MFNRLNHAPQYLFDFYGTQELTLGGFDILSNRVQWPFEIRIASSASPIASFASPNTSFASPIASSASPIASSGNDAYMMT